MKRDLSDEERIGTKGEGRIAARVQADGQSRSFQQTSSVKAAPGSALRVSITARDGRSKRFGKTARILAFVDPLTGELVVRMGMWDVTRSTKGHEIGPQVVWRSDVPVCKVDGSDDS